MSKPLIDLAARMDVYAGDQEALIRRTSGKVGQRDRRNAAALYRSIAAELRLYEISHPGEIVYSEKGKS